MKRRGEIKIRVVENGCHIVLGRKAQRHGYPAATVDGRATTMHKFLYEQKFGVALPLGTVLRHTCDNPKCVNPDHGVPGTHADNVADKVARGRQPVGESIWHLVKLKESQVLEILRSSLSDRELGGLYHVHASTIYAIRRGRSWKHLSKLVHK